MSTAADLLDIADPDVSRVARVSFFNVMARWGVDNDTAITLLGAPGRSTYFEWKRGRGGALSRDTLERISYVLGIYKGLQILFPDPAQADAWVAKPNEAFGGRSALARMAAGNVADLHAVRAYLDHVRGGGS